VFAQYILLMRELNAGNRGRLEWHMEEKYIQQATYFMGYEGQFTLSLTRLYCPITGISHNFSNFPLIAWIHRGFWVVTVVGGLCSDMGWSNTSISCRHHPLENGAWQDAATTVCQRRLCMVGGEFSAKKNNLTCWLKLPVDKDHYTCQLRLCFHRERSEA
jgi:hypothetical protein